MEEVKAKKDREGNGLMKWKIGEKFYLMRKTNKHYELRKPGDVVTLRVDKDVFNKNF